jgi:hypothetical protein
MNSLLILIFLVFLLVFFAAYIKSTHTSLPLDELLKPKPYYSTSPLTKTETIFYHRLVEALPDHVVLAQVQLASFISVDKSLIDRTESYKWQNPLSQQSVDFLICSKEFSIVTAIELDDKSHNNEYAIKRDEKKNSSLAAAKVPLIRWHAERMPLNEEIRQEISKYIPSTGQAINISEENEWLFEPQPEFFSQSKNKASVPLKLFFGLILAGFVFWGMPKYAGNPTKTITDALTNNHNLQIQEIERQNQQRLQENLEKQRAEKNAQIENRKQELIAQQKRMQVQDQIRAEASREESIKEAIWNRDFKNKVDCTNRNDIVACGNDNIANRRKFEVYWEANKSKLLIKE